MTTIRAMERVDIEPLLDMLGELNTTGTASDPRFVLADDWRTQMRALILEKWLGVFHPFPPAWVAVDGAEHVGFIQGDIVLSTPLLVRPQGVKIGNLWVNPAYRRKGLGRELVEAYVGAARGRGYPWVEVGTLGKDARAVGFWKALGFDDWRVTLISVPE